MDRKDIGILVILVGLLFAWPIIDRQVISRVFPAKPAPAVKADATPAALPADTTLAASPDTPAAATQPDLTAAPPPTPAAAAVVADKSAGSALEPDRPATGASRFFMPRADATPAPAWRLDNGGVSLQVSAAGAAILEATLAGYPATEQRNSGPVVMDFATLPALVYSGLPGLGGSDLFEVVGTPGPQSIVLSRTTPGGLTLRRTLVLHEEYQLSVTDEFTNASSQPVNVTGAHLQLGLMHNLPGKAIAGLSTLGVDALAVGNNLPSTWGDKLPGFFNRAEKDTGILPQAVEEKLLSSPVDWLAVKNTYFAQILAPAGGGEAVVAYLQRIVDPGELTEPPENKPRMTGLAAVAAALVVPDIVLQPGETVTRSMNGYLGPKQYWTLKKLGLQQEAVMEFASTGFWAFCNPFMVPIKEALLWLLITLHDYVWPHNYGLAIIILTILVRFLFWPITHKSNESMKRMQALQPEIKALREKYKSNPQKLQQETMALYKKNKVNPMGGCLPMLIQIPVFIGLFIVLRNAIELRFAPFLWVHDLSQPENLLKDLLPIPLNILPLIMSATMYWQQVLTPSGGDPQQQKIMQFMPVMMLFFFYTMPAGLVLYWTVNQCLMIMQLIITKRKQAAATARAAAA